MFNVHFFNVNWAPYFSIQIAKVIRHPPIEVWRSVFWGIFPFAVSRGTGGVAAGAGSVAVGAGGTAVDAGSGDAFGVCGVGVAGVHFRIVVSVPWC